MEATIYNSRTGETAIMPQMLATERTRLNRDWSFTPPAPRDWEKQTPRYRATRDLHPMTKPRLRTEPPLSSSSDIDAHQYASGPISKGDIVETKDWPHVSFQALNYAGERVLEFFNSSPKSRLPRSPWVGDRLRLENGLSGNATPNFQRLEQRA